MKATTAADLLDLAFRHNDLDAFELACQAKPWATKKINPMHTMGEYITDAKHSRKETVAGARAIVAPYLAMLAQYGYAASGSALSALIKVDRPLLISYARAGLSFEEQHPEHTLILHKLLQREALSPKCLQELAGVGVDHNKQDKLGNTPLHVLLGAMQRIRKPEKILQYLIALEALYKSGADFTLKNKCGVSPGDIIPAVLTLFSDNPEFCGLLSDIQAQVLSHNTVVAQQSSMTSSRRL